MLFIGAKCHGLNSVIVNGLRKSFVQFKNDEQTINKLYSFIRSSYGKLSLLTHFCQLFEQKEFVLKKTMEIRWNSTLEPVKMICQNYKTIAATKVSELKKKQIQLKSQIQQQQHNNEHYVLNKHEMQNHYKIYYYQMQVYH
jgi:uncharacterized protein YdcH (DUF465 family)